MALCISSTPSPQAIATAKYNKFKTGEYERKSTEVSLDQLPWTSCLGPLITPRPPPRLNSTPLPT